MAHTKKSARAALLEQMLGCLRRAMADPAVPVAQQLKAVELAMKMLTIKDYPKGGTAGDKRAGAKGTTRTQTKQLGRVEAEVALADPTEGPTANGGNKAPQVQGGRHEQL